MSERSFQHAPHGDTLHDIAIMIGKSICAERGYTFLDPRPLHDKHIYPGIPDIYIRRSKKTPSGAKVIHGYEDWIIEIESNPTAASISKKRKQFSGDGITDLLIVDLRKLGGNDGTPKSWRNVKLGDLVDFMSEWVP